MIYLKIAYFKKLNSSKNFIYIVIDEIIYKKGFILVV